MLHALLSNKLEGDVFASGGEQVLADCSLVVRHAVPQSIVLFSFQETHNTKCGCVEIGLVNVEICLAEQPKRIMEGLEAKYVLKAGSVSKPTTYLGAKVSKYRLEHSDNPDKVRLGLGLSRQDVLHLLLDCVFPEAVPHVPVNHKHFGSSTPYLCVHCQYRVFTFLMICSRFRRTCGTHQANAGCSVILFATVYSAT
jgi:hypothetical protein